MARAFLLIAAAWFTGLPVPAQDSLPSDPVLMKPVFEAGKTYRFISNTTVLMAPPGGSQRRIVMVQQARYDVSDPATGARGVSVRGLTERLQVQIQSGSKSVSYDSISADNDDTAIGRHFESTVNRYVKLALNPKMRIVSQQEAGRSAAASPLPGLPRFGPDELVQIVNMLPQPFAPDPVEIGNEWVLQGKRPVGDLGELGFEVTYQLAGQEEFENHPCYSIYFRGHMTGDILDPSSRSINFQGSKIEGRLLYDPAINMTRYSEHNVIMSVNLPDRESGEVKVVPMQQKVVLRLMQIAEQQ